MKHIAILDNTFYIRNRIRELTQDLNAEVIETTTSRQMINLMHTHDEIDLIIMEINMPNEDGLSVLNEIRAIKNDVPIIILTSENRRSSFIKGIQQGASDYILKPFDDHFLISRITEHLDRKRAVVNLKNIGDIKETQGHGLFLDFQNYLDKELKKAIKGKYEVSLLISLFFKPIDEFNSSIEKEYNKVSQIVFPHLQNVVFDTDIFMKYGSQSFIGVFPFCSIENQHFIEDKFQNVFENLQVENPLISNYSMINHFVTFPNDGKTRDEIMETMVNQLFKIIENNKIALAQGELDYKQ